MLWRRKSRLHCWLPKGCNGSGDRSGADTRMPRMMFDGCRISGVAQEKVRKILGTKGFERSAIGIVQNTFAADLMDFPLAIVVDDRDLAAKGIVVIKPAQRGLNTLRKGRNVRPKPERRCEIAIDIEPRCLRNLARRTIVRHGELASESGADAKRRQEQNRKPFHDV